MSYMAIYSDKMSNLPRAWGIAPTTTEARRIAREQADKYEAAHPDNPLRESPRIHRLPDAA